MRRHRLFALLLAFIFVLPAAVNAAEQVKQNSVVKCERPAVEYLKEAERLYPPAIPKSKTSDYAGYRSSALATLSALELYKICSEIEKNFRQ